MINKLRLGIYASKRVCQIDRHISTTRSLDKCKKAEFKKPDNPNDPKPVTAQRDLLQTCEAAPDCSKDTKEELETCMVESCMVDVCKPQPKIVIIGGGVAGLSTAQRLVQCGLTDFIVLEATDRPGGRIHSCWLGDVVAELGAAWIDGGSIANPIFNLASQEGLLQHPLSRPDPSRGLFCTSDGRAVDLTVSITAYHAFQNIERQATALFMACGKPHGSLHNFINLRIQQELHHFPIENRYDAARVMYGLSNSIRSKFGADLTAVSADQYGSFIDIPGGRIRVPLGYVGVLAPLLRDLPDCSVRYCKAVNTVRWGAVQDNAPRAAVRCCDGEEFHADYVVITVSLGCLKQHADQLFCPALPAEKMAAIKKLGYGNVDKIYMEYAKPFWVWCEGDLRFAWSAEELNDRTDWGKGLCSIEECPSSKHVLCALVAGPEAARMELATDEEVAMVITRVLRQFTGDPSLPYPRSILRSKWGTDPHFCGAHSYMGIDSTVGHQCDLGAPLPGPCDPVPPILLFAGEATSPGHFATVHGARLSGIREAERIIQLTKKFGGKPKFQEAPCA